MIRKVDQVTWCLRHRTARHVFHIVIQYRGYRWSVIAIYKATEVILNQKLLFTRTKDCFNTAKGLKPLTIWKVTLFWLVFKLFCSTFQRCRLWALIVIIKMIPLFLRYADVNPDCSVLIYDPERRRQVGFSIALAYYNSVLIMTMKSFAAEIFLTVWSFSFRQRAHTRLG